MRLHTFIVDSAAEAVERIRGELGPEAVVVSVRRMPQNGLGRWFKNPKVEVVAGVEEEPTPEKNPLEQLREEIRELKQQVATTGPRMEESPRTHAAQNFYPEADRGGSQKGWRVSRLLTQTGLLPVFAEQIIEDLAAQYGEIPPPTLADEVAFVEKWLSARWRAPGKTKARTHIFIGPPGSGKSTALCKWLAQTALIEGAPAVVCQLDTHMSNPSPLPSIYAEVLAARFERSVPNDRSVDELCFVDLPGMDPADEKGRGKFEGILQQFPESQLHLVLNGAYESSLLMDLARRWTHYAVDNIILSHMDEEPRWGKAWNLVLGTNFSVGHFSCGQNIPGDFVMAGPGRVFARQFRTNHCN